MYFEKNKYNFVDVFSLFHNLKAWNNVEHFIVLNIDIMY